MRTSKQACSSANDLKRAIVLSAMMLAAVSCQSQEYKVLYRFSSKDGSFPQARLILGSKGSAYGTTMTGGQNGAGTIFKLSSAKKAIYSIPGFSGDNPTAYPLRGLVQDSAGNLYGTTAMGGSFGSGAVFKLDSKGNETTLHSFSAGNDGDEPQSALLRDSAGNLYGTTVLGGKANLGTVFKIDPQGNETITHSFSGGPDGEYPYTGVAGSPAGYIVGVTGGDGTTNWGNVFRIDSAGKYTSLYNFTGGPDGGQPMGALTMDGAGNLYGTTESGGTFLNGTVFKLDIAGTETVLYSFRGGVDGAQPQSSLVRDAAGNLFGTTVFGGASNMGTIFEIDSNGVEKVLHSFTGGTDGQYPYAGLVRDLAGNLYGTTSEGGANYGTIFVVTR